jgi:hypothetical protein
MQPRGKTSIDDVRRQIADNRRFDEAMNNSAREPNEYDSWFVAWAQTIADEPNRPCHCGGTFSQHGITCPYAPPYGYDREGKPIKESQIPKVARELGRKAAERLNEEVFRQLGIQLGD